MKIELYNGDCLEMMDKLIEAGIVVDAIITDPPYGTTACKSDSIIPMNEFVLINDTIYQNKNDFIDSFAWDILKQEGVWQKLTKLIKPNGAIIFTASQPFTSYLVMSNPKLFKYSLVYQKTTPTGHLNAKKMPMRVHEDILVFYKNSPTYNPQKTTGHIRKVSSADSKRNCKKTEVYGNHRNTGYDSTERYPLSVLKFSTDKQKSKFHPTQKPVALMEYLIKTYTNEGEIVLDFTMGSGSTGVAAKQTGRNFIGIELDENYFNIAKDRIYNTDANEN